MSTPENRPATGPKETRDGAGGRAPTPHGDSSSGGAGAGASKSGTVQPGGAGGVSGKAPGKASGTDGSLNRPGKGGAGHDWSAFRSVVVLVGLITAGFGAYYLITGTAGLPESNDTTVNATLENQFRFFSAMMVGVGAAFITIAVKFQWANMLWLVCLMIFIGGIGRVLSWAFSGTPHYLMIILMVVELAFPAALLVWHKYIAKTTALRREYSGRS